jgi:hypothetical protein
MTLPFLSGLHPAVDALEAFALRDTGATPPPTIEKHLARCGRCQRRVWELRSLRELASAEPVPPMSDRVLARVLERWDVGESFILPDAGTTSSARPPARNRWMVAASILAAVILVSVVVVSPRSALEARRTAGDLATSQRFDGASPTLSVRYRPGGTLVSANSLVLLATEYEDRRIQGKRISVPLEVRRDGLFAADIPLTEGIVLLQLSVATADWQHVDDNDARGWEHLVEDRAGHPVFGALWVEYAVHGFDDWERAHAAAEAMWHQYPQRPEGLRFTLSGAMQLAGPANTDSVVQVFRPHIEALHAKLSSVTVDATVMGEMALLAAQARDTSMRSYWQLRMIREFPRDPGTIQQRTFMLFDRQMPPPERMAALERLWVETGGNAIQLLMNAFDFVVRAGDTAAIERWGGRLMSFGSAYAPYVAAQYVRIPDLRARGEDIVRRSLSALSPVTNGDWAGSLRAPPSRTTARASQSFLTTLGIALIADGKVNAATDTLRRAAAVAWEPGVLRALGDVELLVADSAAATRAYAWAIGDPRTSPARADTLRKRLGHFAAGAPWDAAVAEGQAVLGNTTLITSIRRSFDPGAALVDADGGRRTLEELVASPVAVIAFVSRHCAPSVADLPALQATATRLAVAGVLTITIVEENPSAEARRAIARYGYSDAILFDNRAELSRSMRQAGTPQYFVVVAGRVVRFETHRAEDLPLLVDALKTER